MAMSRRLIMMRQGVRPGVRHFQSSGVRAAATNFAMPAMSPTMTEGSINRWLVAEGATYSAGDVLLEIETDKATMDVEAQEDGILAKIIVGEGEKTVKVGTPIAVMAEERDDLANLEMPKQEQETVATEQKKAKEQASNAKVEETPDKKENKSKGTAKPSKATSTPAGHDHATPTNADGSALLPSVLSLIRFHNVASDDVSKIKASGPKGRLLKGDILAHVGQIGKQSASELKKGIDERSKLDLSNIKKAAPTEKPRDKAAAAARSAEAAPVPTTIELRKSIDLVNLVLAAERASEQLGVDFDVTELAARAAALAMEDVPQFGLSPRAADDVLFDEIVATASTSTQTVLPPRPLYAQSTRDQLPLELAEYYEGGPVPLPRKAPLGSSLVILAAEAPPTAPTSQPAQKTSSLDDELIDFLSGIPTRPSGSAALATPAPTAETDVGRSMIASLAFTKGDVDPEAASVYLDRLSQYIESPAHLFL